MTLYFALTARLPFASDDRQGLFEVHLSGSPPLSSRVAPEPVPDALERVIQRCMAKNPVERYPSTQAVLEALQEV